MRFEPLMLMVTAITLQAQEISHSTGPVVIHKVEPVYTSEAIAAKLQGTVILSAMIGRTESRRIFTWYGNLERAYQQLAEVSKCRKRVFRNLVDWAMFPKNSAGFTLGHCRWPMRESRTLFRSLRPAFCR
jgi:hypothetical protein